MGFKFKVWDKEQKKFLEINWEGEDTRHTVGKANINYSDEIYITLSGYVDDDETGNPYEVDAEILPSTGVEDINKKEAYLGDILKKTKVEWISEKQRAKCEKDNSFYIVKKQSDSNNMYLEYNFNVRGYWETNNLELLRIKDLEIVGNIYENPEMIIKG